MKTKIIPFDLETVKKTQAGEIEGKMVEVTTKKITYNSHGCIAIDQKVDKFIELPEETSEHQFKPFDKVLVRKNDEDGQYWQPKIYSFFHPAFKEHVTTDGMMYEEVLPYEGNEHLVGTTDEPKED